MKNTESIKNSMNAVYTSLLNNNKHNHALKMKKIIDKVLICLNRTIVKRKTFDTTNSYVYNKLPKLMDRKIIDIIYEIYRLSYEILGESELIKEKYRSNFKYIDIMYMYHDLVNILTNDYDFPNRLVLLSDTINELYLENSKYEKIINNYENYKQFKPSYSDILNGRAFEIFDK